MRPRRGAALAALLAAVAACSAATPPSPRSGAATTSAAPGSAAAPPTPSTSASAERSLPPSPNRLDLEVGALDRAWIWPMLDFASDRGAVIWSSGVLDGPVGGTAPDLWRYVPGADAPELLWRNPERDRQLAKVAGDLDVWAFAEISSLGERWWKLWLLTEPGGQPILLDAHPGDDDIPSLVPSFDVDAGRIAWTSFGRDASGRAVSRLWMAQAPDWTPQRLREADASALAYWLPSLYADRMAYVEVQIAADTADDIRHVMLMDLTRPEADAIQLDTSGNATMPVLTDQAVIWKEPDRGFAMFNWGRLFRYTFETTTVHALRVGPQEYVNYPSGGDRFVAMWGSDSSMFAVHDLERGASRLIATVEPASSSIFRPHLAGSLLVWLRSEKDGLGNGPPGVIEYAWLPEPGSDRGR